MQIWCQTAGRIASWFQENRKTEKISGW